MKHPIHETEIHVYKKVEGYSDSPEYIARLYPYKTWPVVFSGSTLEDARDKVEAFKQDVILKHEAAFIKRQEALTKARAKRKDKTE